MSFHTPLCLVNLQELGNTIISRNISQCRVTSIYYITFFSLIIAYKVIIHIIGLVLAFLTRKVQLDPLNDSRYAAAIIYSSCFMLSLATLVIFLSPESDPNVMAGAWTPVVFVEICIFLGFTFIPKVIAISKIRTFDKPQSYYSCTNNYWYREK